jgi:uncharacterized protein (TIGR02677 family)
MPIFMPGAHLPEQRSLRAVPETRYLAAERAEHYRLLLRVFDERQRAEYATQLSVHDVFVAVSASQPGWSIDRCKHDLDQLVAWGNLERCFDRAARHASIESFRAPSVLYRATPFTLALERFLVTQQLADEQVGRFRHADLPDLLEAFTQLDGLLGGSPGGATDRGVAQTWSRAEALFQRIERDAARYLRSLEAAGELAGTDVPAFQAYKASVVSYVQSFASQLNDAVVRLRALFERWTATGAEQRLIGCLLASAAPTPWPRPLEQREAEVANQVRALVAWCRPGAGADHLVRRARAEIATVIVRAHVLSEQAQVRAGYVADLDAVARAALVAPDVQSASRLAGAALGHESLPPLPASFGTLDGPSGASAWAGPAAVQLMLHPIDRPPRTSELVAPAPVDDAQVRQALEAREHQRRAQEQQRIARLFPANVLAIRSLVLEDAADCALLLGAIRHCLQDPHHRTRLSDGSAVQITNPETAEWTTIETPSQRYHVPGFLMHRHPPDAQNRGQPGAATTTLASRAA